MGKKILGLTIDINKTGGHFSSSNEMFGTLISGIELDGSNTNDITNPNSRVNSTNLNHVHTLD